MTVIDRARTLLEKCIPPTQCGTQSCHNQTFRAASALVWGFGLSPEEGMGLLREWAERGTHKWSDRDLMHKLTSSLHGNHQQPRGHLVTEGEERGQVPDYRPVERDPEPPAKYDAEALKRAQRPDWRVDVDWLRARSPRDPRDVSATDFLEAVYEPGDKVMVFTDLRSQGNFIHWVGKGSFVLGKTPDVTARPARLPDGAPQGMWFLIQPHDGRWYAVPGKTTLSRRSQRSVLSWRYMLLESDHAPQWQWLNAICQMHLPIVAIVTSGNQGAHVLVQVDAASKAEWDAMRKSVLPTLACLGTDPDALKGLVYMRLPGAFREGKMKQVDDGTGKRVSRFVPFPDGRRKQRLLYFNPRPAPLGQARAIGEGMLYQHG
jgi:hypothetical protein